ncbi:NUDIX hydrolase [Ochrobactrum sp. MYb68]|nr:NUDIX hydrolase [Ochrobactrum sp. MYb68]
MTAIPILACGVSVVVLRRVETETEVLLLRRNHTLVGEWCQISGGTEDGEKAWEAALREVTEETGLICIKLYSADICEQFYDVGRNAIIMNPIFVGFINADARVTINEEHSEFCWASLTNALNLVPFSGQRNVLKHVDAEFVQREPVERLLVHKLAHGPRDPRQSD